MPTGKSRKEECINLLTKYHNESVASISKRHGIPAATLYKWKKYLKDTKKKNKKVAKQVRQIVEAQQTPVEVKTPPEAKTPWGMAFLALMAIVVVIWMSILGGRP